MCKWICENLKNSKKSAKKRRKKYPNDCMIHEQMCVVGLQIIKDAELLLYMIDIWILYKDIL